MGKAASIPISAPLSYDRGLSVLRSGRRDEGRPDPRGKKPSQLDLERRGTLEEGAGEEKSSGHGNTASWVGGNESSSQNAYTLYFPPVTWGPINGLSSRKNLDREVTRVT